jgi:hypothetical protein
MPIAFRPNNQTILVIERKTQLFIGTPYTWGLANYIRENFYYDGYEISTEYAYAYIVCG